MKYGFMLVIFVLTLPSCCMRKQKQKTMAPSMVIEDESMMTMPNETMDTTDMAIMQDEMTPDTGAQE